MQIKTELDMNRFCETVGSQLFMINHSCDLSTNEIKDYKSRILLAEGTEKVKKFSGREKELFIQGIKDITYDPAVLQINIKEIPVIYPSGKDTSLEGPMSGVLVHAYDPSRKVLYLQKRGANVSIPYAVQTAGAGFVDFGDNPYNTAKDELKVEAGIIPNDLEQKCVGILPFIKNKYPQPLFLYAFQVKPNFTLDSIPLLNSIKEVNDFSNEIKFSSKDNSKEAHIFAISLQNSSQIIQEIHAKDIFQKGNNEGFFGPILESYLLLNKLLDIN